MTTTTFHVFIATSLDGFIARPDGGLDWLAAFQGDGDNGYGAFIGRHGRHRHGTRHFRGGAWVRLNGPMPCPSS